MSEIKFTPEQQKVIEHQDGNLLVSASAGSGKTKVLIAKIVDIVKSKKSKLKNLLVLTFTNSACGEIKQRLQMSLEESGDEVLFEELEDLPVSDILTIDSFCINIVRQFGYSYGINGNFGIADNSLALFLQNKALENIFALHNKRMDIEFVNLLDSFFEGRTDKNLRESIVSIYNFLRSKSGDKNFYIEKLNELFAQDYSPAFKYLNDEILLEKDEFLKKMHEILSICDENGQEKLLVVVANAIKTAENFGDDFLKNLNFLKCGVDFGKMISNQKDDEIVCQIKSDFQNAKKQFSQFLKDIYEKSGLKFFSIQKIFGDIQNSKSLLQNLFKIVDEFDTEYSRLKRDYGVFDFSDIERFALEILKDEKVKNQEQEKYDYIFIDEYQDTSELQESILEKITTGENLFMVGDFKQSIYRFRQAEPKIFINKYNQYKKMQTKSEVVELNKNFRSDKAILQFDNFVFDNIFKEKIDDFDYYKKADLEFGGKIKFDTTSKVKIIVIDDKKNDEEDDENVLEVQKIQSAKIYSVRESEKSFDELKKVEREAILLSDQISKTIGNYFYDSNGDYRKITYRDIAVISRDKKSVISQTKTILKKFGIPVYASYEEELSDCYDMQVIFDILRAIENRHNDNALITSMSSIVGGISFDELARIRSEKRDGFFYDAVENYAKNNFDSLSDKIKILYKKFDKYFQASHYKNISELILFIVSEEKLENYFLVNGVDNFENHIKLLIENISSIKENSLSEFVNYIDTFAGNLKFENQIRDSENAVMLTTIHGSKGLEYPVVFLISAGSKFSQKSIEKKIVYDNDWGISKTCFDFDSRSEYDGIINIAFKHKVLNENIKEEKRLLYVALTRPQNFLTIIGTTNAQNLTERKSILALKNSHSYLDLIFSPLRSEEIDSFLTNFNFTKRVEDTDVIFEKIDSEKTEFLINSNEQPKYENLDIDKGKLINILTRKFDKNNLAKKNSVTQIMQEEEHYNISDFSYLKNDKTGDEDFLAIGTAYHKYMQLIDFTDDKTEILKQIEKLESESISPSEKGLVKIDEIVTAVQTISKLIQSTNKVLKEQQFLIYMPANLLVNTDKTNKILVQGVADLIIFREDEIILVDYKTSRLKTEKEYVEKYSTQLNIYARAIEKFYQKKVGKKLIYSFFLNKVVTI